MIDAENDLTKFYSFMLNHQPFHYLVLTPLSAEAIYKGCIVDVEYIKGIRFYFLHAKLGKGMTIFGYVPAELYDYAHSYKYNTFIVKTRRVVILFKKINNIKHKKNYHKLVIGNYLKSLLEPLGYDNKEIDRMVRHYIYSNKPNRKNIDVERLRAIQRLVITNIINLLKPSLYAVSRYSV